MLKRIDSALDDTVPARRPITVRDVLTSTFGLGMDMTMIGTPIMAAVFEQGITPNLPVPMPEQDEWMRRLGTLPLMYQPGERWQYQISSDLLGVLVSRVTGTVVRRVPARAHLRAARHEGHRLLACLPTRSIACLRCTRRTRRPASSTCGTRRRAAGTAAPPAFQGGGGGLNSTADDYNAYFRMLLNHGRTTASRSCPEPAVELMTSNRLTPELLASREALARDNVHISFGQGQHGGWGFGMAVRTYRGDYAPIGQFGWDGGAGTVDVRRPGNQIVGVLLTQVGMTAPSSVQLMHDFWTTVYQSIDD